MNKDVIKVAGKKPGFFGKIANSIAGIPIGIILIIIGACVLWSNEQNNVKNIKDVKELRDQVIQVTSDKVDPSNEGKLIATNGKLDFGESKLTDSLFGVSRVTPKLVRKVEMYQWIEEKKTDDDNNTTYTYKTEWSSDVIDSSNFYDTKKTNPTYMKYEGTTIVTPNDIKVGEYNINTFKDSLTADTKLNNLEGAILPEGYKSEGGFITNAENLSEPKVGDLRISFYFADYTDVSVLGKQYSSSITSYSTKTKHDIKMMQKGIKSGEELITAKEKGDKFKKWTMRILGVILIIAGVGMLIGPLTTLIGFIPFLGNVINAGIGVVSFIIGLAISLVIIAIAWFVARPVLSICLIVVIVGLIVLLKMYAAKNKAPVNVPKNTEEQK